MSDTENIEQVISDFAEAGVQVAKCTTEDSAKHVALLDALKSLQGKEGKIGIMDHDSGLMFLIETRKI